MKVILFGASGMVGQGVLRECLLDPAVDRVLSVGRSASGRQDPKLEELVQADLLDLRAASDRLAGYDACFFCLGISAAGKKESEYRQITYDLTMAVAATLVEGNPAMTFIYVSGSGTDRSGRSRMMWARVKGATENALLEMPFRAAFMFRPGYIQPLHGVRSKTRWYGAFYAVLAPLYPLLKRVPKYVTTTECVGRAMIRVAACGYPQKVLESRDINQVCRNPP